jgi:hypothetical protein
MISERQCKPYTLVDVREGNYSYVGQLISRPIVADGKSTIMVRRVPGDPSTMVELPLDKLLPINRVKVKYVHYAVCSGRLSFPVDMLRYDMATPVNFEFTIDPFYHNTLTKILPSWPADDTRLIIATARTYNKHPWTDARWVSFGWSVKVLKVLPILPNQ